jgi:uncharacterized membrane protein
MVIVVRKNKQLGYGILAFGIVLILLLSFIKAQVDEEGAILCDAFSSNPALDMNDCPAHKNSASWYITAAFAVAALVLAAGGYLSFVQKPEPDSREFRKVDDASLDNEEKNVYSMLKNSRGSMYQSDIMKATGYSKVKVTRILDRLEAKEIVERRRRGMTNIIVLK